MLSHLGSSFWTPVSSIPHYTWAIMAKGTVFSPRFIIPDQSLPCCGSLLLTQLTGITRGLGYHIRWVSRGCQASRQSIKLVFAYSFYLRNKFK